MRTVLVALLALALAPSIVEAGGGSKNTGTIRVLNNGRDTLGVVLNASAALQAKLAAGTATQADITAAGGQFVGVGGTAVFSNQKAGTTNVGAAFVRTTAGVTLAGAPGSVSVNLGKGGTVNITATEGADPVAPLFTPGAAILTVQ